MLYLIFKNYVLFILGWEKSNSDHQYLARSGKTIKSNSPWNVRILSAFWISNGDFITL